MRTDVVYYMDMIFDEDRPRIGLFVIKVNERAKFWLSNPKAKMISEKDYNTMRLQISKK